MISAGEFRNGITFELDGNVYQVIQFQHVKPGKGAAFVRTKIKNVITGGVVERTFSPTDKMPKAHIERKDMEYLYNDGDLYYFMDTETYEQTPLNSSARRIKCRKRISSGRTWSICTTMGIYIISWIQRRMSKLR